MFTFNQANSQTAYPPVEIQLKAAVQGLFIPELRKQSRDCDLELKFIDANDLNIVHGTATVTIDKASLTGSVSLNSIPRGKYYISIKTANSIETFTNEPVDLVDHEVNVIDFSSSKSKAYAGNMLEYDFGGTKTACIFTGDVDGDNIVDATDYAAVENDVLLFVSGNVLTDLDGDEFVDGSDLAIVEFNSNNYVQSIRPDGTSASKFAKNDKTDFVLRQNFPNPFNPTTTIAFSLNNSSSVRLSVFDMAGREVAVLVNQNLNSGNHSFNWDASSLASGAYFYRLSVNGVQSVKQMHLIK